MYIILSRPSILDILYIISRKYWYLYIYIYSLYIYDLNIYHTIHIYQALLDSTATPCHQPTTLERSHCSSNDPQLSAHFDQTFCVLLVSSGDQKQWIKMMSQRVALWNFYIFIHSNCIQSPQYIYIYWIYILKSWQFYSSTFVSRVAHFEFPSCLVLSLFARSSNRVWNRPFSWAKSLSFSACWPKDLPSIGKWWFSQINWWFHQQKLMMN